RTARPYLLVGWLWFLASLVPVIGLVQVGDQAMADRYAYLPLIGLFLIIAWGGAAFLSRLRIPATLRGGVAVATLATVSLLTVREVGYWQDSVSIWSRTLQLTTDNLLAEQNIAAALTERGDSEQAAQHFLNVLRLDPTDLASHVDLGVYYGAHGQT